MAIQIEIVLIAGVVAIGFFLGRAIVTGITISRRRAHHLAQQTGALPVPLEVELPPRPLSDR